MFTADNISKNIASKCILNACSLHLESGRFTAVVGPNGAGKTTLLKIMAAETRYAQGKVSLNGKLLKTYKSRDLSRARAVLPQHTVVNFPFTVAQVIEIGRYAHKTTNAQNKEIIEEALSLTQLTSFRERAYQTLSGGEKQRVQMARVIAQIWDQSTEPKFLLLDEPTSSLDLAQQQALLSLAKSLCSRNIGVMAVLHDLNLAIQYADEILFLKNGNTIAYGPVKQTATCEVIEKTFDHPVRMIEDNDQLVIVPRTHAQEGAATKSDYKKGLSLTSPQLCNTFNTIIGDGQLLILKNKYSQT